MRKVKSQKRSRKRSRKADGKEVSGPIRLLDSGGIRKGTTPRPTTSPAKLMAARARAFRRPLSEKLIELAAATPPMKGVVGGVYSGAVSGAALGATIGESLSQASLKKKKKKQNSK